MQLSHIEMYILQSTHNRCLDVQYTTGVWMYSTLQVFGCTVHYRCLDVQYTTGVWMYNTLQVFGCTVHYGCLDVHTYVQ